MTHKELIKLHGQRVTCKITGTEITDAKISVDGDEDVYVCQNKRDGNSANDKLGYAYSWRISREDYKYENYDRDCTDIKIIPSYNTEKPKLIVHQKELLKWTDDDTLYSKDTITFAGKEYTKDEWTEFVKRVQKINKRFKKM